MKAIVIDPTDNVATALVPLRAGESVSVRIGDREEKIRLLSDVPQGHKFALREIARREIVIKYGEPIGQGRTDIASGEHVHVDNVESPRKEAVSQRGRDDSTFCPTRPRRYRHGVQRVP